MYITFVGHMMEACYTRVCRVVHFVDIQPRYIKGFAQCCKRNKFEVNLKIWKKRKSDKVSKFNSYHTNT